MNPFLNSDLKRKIWDNVSKSGPSKFYKSLPQNLLSSVLNTGEKVKLPQKFRFKKICT